MAADLTSKPSLPIVRPLDISSGIGALDRAEMCQMIALLECVDAFFLAKGATAGAAAKLGLNRDIAAEHLQAAEHDLANSPASDNAMRFRLWGRLTEALAIPPEPPLSTRSATKAASAIAIRASERLTPSIRKRHYKAARNQDQIASTKQIANRAADLWNATKTVVLPEQPLPFPDIVAEEMLALLANDEVVETVARNTDPEIAKALRDGQVRARNAMAAGGVWAGGAAVVANAGFLPYMLAAQLSAVIPMVSGPTLVSLLATLVNPVTVFAGVAALGWLGMGRGSRIIRSQLAARLGVLLAARGTRSGENGLERFLSGMRALDKEPSGAVSWMNKRDRAAVRRKLYALDGRMREPLPPPAGIPPGPWATKRLSTDAVDVAAALGLTAGEMLWHAAALDSNVMKAADFSRSEDLGDPMAFACRAAEFLTTGAGWSLRGYTAERLVLDQLVAAGHDVRLATESNTPGFDLIVDGQVVQVKCGTSISNLTKHFEDYPDVPVIANAALAERATEVAAPWAHLVTTLPGFEIATIEQQIAETLGHAADLADPDILQFALSIGILRGGIEVARGRVPVSDLPAWLLLDGASRGVLAFAGGKAGAWFGLIAVGPAGALILGPAIAGAALIGNNTLKTTAQKHLRREWLEELLRATEELLFGLIASLEHRIKRLEERRRDFACRAQQSDLDAWMARRAQDDLIAALEDRISLDTMHPKDEVDVVHLLFAARDLAPVDPDILDRAHKVQSVLACKPGLKTVMIDTARNGTKALRSRPKGVWYSARGREAGDHES